MILLIFRGTLNDAIQILEKIKGLNESDANADLSKNSKKEGSIKMIKIFISHSSEDKLLAEYLIELLKNALNLGAKDIRCTSVDGYRLTAGANTDEQLKHEVCSCEVLIGVISPEANDSLYVLFELGARWGSNKSLILLLAPGISPKILEKPLSGLNALRCDNAAQLQQLLEDLSKMLNITIDKPSAYQKYIENIVRMPPSDQKERSVREEHTDYNLTPLQKRIMQNVHRFGDHKFTARHISTVLKISEMEAQYNLDELASTFQLLDWFGNMDPEVEDRYTLTHEGRGYLLRLKDSGTQ